MYKGILQEKSFSFSVSIIKIYKKLVIEKKEFTLSKQLLKSGTSIGANIEEAFGAISNKDFLNKIHISYKEARETKYWIKLLTETNYLDPITSESLLDRIEELLRILGATIKKAGKPDDQY